MLTPKKRKALVKAMSSGEMENPEMPMELKSKYVVAKDKGMSPESIKEYEQKIQSIKRRSI